MTAPTPQQVMQAQGTRLEEAAPWESYKEEMDVKMSEELAEQVADYATRYHDNSSNQNKEELARWQEMNRDNKDEYKWCTEEEYNDLEARMGRTIHSSDFINTLRNKLHIKCWYRQHPHEDKLTLLVSKNDGMQPAEVACWVKNGWMPEYTIMGFDEHGVPLSERYRGWRTCLLQMILKGFVTETAAHKVFGAAERCCAERYNSILYGLRNTVVIDD